MARRVPPQVPAATTSPFPAAEVAPVPAPSMPGGAPGLLPGAATKIHFPGVAEFAAGRSEEAPDAPKAKRFVVYDCPKPAAGPQGYRVLLGSCISFMVDGKVVDTNAYDIDLLKAQGVKLRELDEEG